MYVCMYVYNTQPNYVLDLHCILINYKKLQIFYVSNFSYVTKYLYMYALMISTHYDQTATLLSV